MDWDRGDEKKNIVVVKNKESNGLSVGKKG
jgi:hypothetical protein